MWAGSSPAPLPPRLSWSLRKPSCPADLPLLMAPGRPRPRLMAPGRPRPRLMASRDTEAKGAGCVQPPPLLLFRWGFQLRPEQRLSCICSWSGNPARRTRCREDRRGSALIRPSPGLRLNWRFHPGVTGQRQGLLCQLSLPSEPAPSRDYGGQITRF